MKKFVLILSILIASLGMAQEGINTPSVEKEYRAVATKFHDLVHTKLNAKFDYTQSRLLGKVWLTLKPHFYATDSLKLDAKGMDIHEIAIERAGKRWALKYQYDSLELSIKLDKTYQKEETYTLYIDYTAKPNEFKSKGSAAITDARGLYFINPKGTEKNKPTQIWTQGETEASSVWIPTLDKTNQKTTQEFILTYPAKYVSLSNGRLASSKKNADGTKTDTWMMELPHAPYLFFIGIGDFAIVKDTYKGKEVNYYVEPAYEKAARKIFGNTPEMMKFFSEKVTGIEYPWNKYSQMVARDYVSGAMENTTATLHQENAQQTLRELIDDNHWEGTIAHELFHQWFGDYVTAESWSNLTVNESFADYSQYLWEEYKYGKDAAEYENAQSMAAYLASPEDAKKDLVRFHYRDKEDMFDLVSYQKGGRILHMLRKLVGDQAFFTSLNKYLTQNKFGVGSAHKLRLAFEEVTGKDLNWFFNQWYFGSGHPNLSIRKQYDETKKLIAVIVEQTQEGNKIFTFPLSISLFEGSKKTSHQVWVKNQLDTFYFPSHRLPNLVTVDDDNSLLAEKQYSKTLSELVHQYQYAGNYLNRKEALDFAFKNGKEIAATELIKQGLKDTFPILKIQSIRYFLDKPIDANTMAVIENIATKDISAKARAMAIDVLGKQKNAKYKSLFEKAMQDSSYSVAGAALEALSKLDSIAALSFAKKTLTLENKGRLLSAISNLLIQSGDDSIFPILADEFEETPLSDAKFRAMVVLVEMLKKISNPNYFKRGIDLIVKLRDEIPAQIKAQTDPYLNGMILKSILEAKQSSGEKEMALYVSQQLPK